MGLFSNIMDSLRRCPIGIGLAGLLVLTAGVTGSDASRADDSKSPAAIERSVSTSPIRVIAQATTGGHERDPDATRSRALTRAAERKRIDAMSPTRWLSRYGHVSIERRD